MLGFSQEQLAGTLGIERSTVARWERAETKPRPWQRPALAQELQVSLDELDELLAAISTVGEPAHDGGHDLVLCVPWSHRGTVEAAAELTRGDDVERRTFLALSGTALTAPLVTSEALHEAFAAALEEKRLSPDEWHERVESYGRAYTMIGADKLSERLAADMVRLQRYTDDPAVWSPAAKLMAIYGKTLPIDDGAKGAVRWYRLAAAMADRSQDVSTRIWVRGASALALAYDAVQIPTAHLFADEALALSESPSLGRLKALIAQAHIAATRRSHQAATQAVEHAQDVWEATAGPEEVSDFAVPQWRFWTCASLLYSRIGDQKRALTAQESALGTIPPTIPRFTTHIELHRSLMLAKTGDKRSGIEHARVALDKLPPQHRTLSMHLMMTEIERC